MTLVEQMGYEPRTRPERFRAGVRYGLLMWALAAVLLPLAMALRGY